MSRTSLLMCHPRYYAIAYEINPWMDVRRQAAKSVAEQQWQRLRDALTKAGVGVRLLPPGRGLPDLVFTANAGLVDGHTFIRSNFRFPQRQAEEPLVERWFQRAGYRVLRLPREINFEGEGDALWVGRVLFLGFRTRSDAQAHESLAKWLHARVLPVELVDKRFYHLDTCFCPLDATSAMWYPNAFDRYGRAVIEANVPNLLAVSRADALRFACNAVRVGSRLILHQGISPALRRDLAKRRLTPVELDLSEFLKAGGSAKCLALRLPSR